MTANLVFSSNVVSPYHWTDPIVPPYATMQENVTQATQRVNDGRATVLNSTDAHGGVSGEVDIGEHMMEQAIEEARIHPRMFFHSKKKWIISVLCTWVARFSSLVPFHTGEQLWADEGDITM